MLLIKFYADLINKRLKELSFSKTPKSLYNPIKYILDLGGKRIRPYLVLMSTNTFGIDPKLSLNAALSVECFHNFTLMNVSYFVYKKFKNTYIVSCNEFFILL